MKKLLVPIFTILLINQGNGQNINLVYKNALKIYNVTSFDENNKFKSDADFTKYTTGTLQLLHPALAFQWKTKKNNFNEIELLNCELNKTVSKTEVSAPAGATPVITNAQTLLVSSVSLRLEHIWNFRKTNDKKLVPSVGLAVNPYFRQINFTPSASSSYPSSENYFGIRAFLIPRLTWYVKPRIFIDINMPVCFSDTYFLIEKEDNPAIPVNQKKVFTLDQRAFPIIFSGRIGLGIKL